MVRPEPSEATAMDELFARNRAWAERMRARDPEFFTRLAGQQAPRLLWIGCADSRVAANQLLDLDPGTVFVHRNIANLVIHTDINMLSVLQFAVEILRVPQVVVCGHYGCGGVRAAMADRQLGLIDNWLRHIKDVYDQHAAELDGIADPGRREDRLVELNVLHQTLHVARSTVVQNAWADGRRLEIRAWVYGLEDGLLRDLGYRVRGPEEIGAIYRMMGGGVT